MADDAAKQKRVGKFKDNVAALNKQFLEWFTEQVKAKPEKLATSGLSDYLRHASKLRLEYADVIDEGSSAEADGRRRSKLLTLMPICNTKTIHFIRHGEGWHNVGLPNPDSHLTPRGWQQAHALGAHMRQFAITRDVQLVIVSPLMRTLETAAGVFGAPEKGITDNNKDKILMKAQQEAFQAVTEHKEIMVPRNGLKFVAHELCRERLGPGPCDGRRPRSKAAAAFPGVDFSLIEDDQDNLWKPHVAESEGSVVERGRRFLQYIMSLPDVTNVAVVTHSAFLWFTLAVFGHEYTKPVREKLQRWYENCEMRTVVLSDGGGLSCILDETHFPGGHAAVEPQEVLMEDAAITPVGENGREEVDASVKVNAAPTIAAAGKAIAAGAVVVEGEGVASACRLAQKK